MSSLSEPVGGHSLSAARRVSRSTTDRFRKSSFQKRLTRIYLNIVQTLLFLYTVETLDAHIQARFQEVLSINEVSINKVIWQERLCEMDDHDLLTNFENCSLPVHQWDHRAHLKISYLYLCDHPFTVALAKMRQGIKAYNAANNVSEGEFEGYNETTTHAFMQLVNTTMKAYGQLFPTPDADAFCDTHPQLMCKHVLRLFYSPERRSHSDAKTRFIEPDLTTLPDFSASR